MKAHPEIVLIDLVTANSVGNGFRDGRFAVTVIAEDETGCFRQIRLFSSVLHIFLPAKVQGWRGDKKKRGPVVERVPDPAQSAHADQ